jgi:hypothetical protein
MRILPAEGWRRPRSELITEDFPVAVRTDEGQHLAVRHRQVKAANGPHRPVGDLQGANLHERTLKPRHIRSLRGSRSPAGGRSA